MSIGDVGKTGGQFIRPFHLPHRQDYGLRGTSDHVFWIDPKRTPIPYHWKTICMFSLGPVA